MNILDRFFTVGTQLKGMKCACFEKSSTRKNSADLILELFQMLFDEVSITFGEKFVIMDKKFEEMKNQMTQKMKKLTICKKI